MEEHSYIERLHDDILSIMDEIERICTENNIRYYLAFGSLLGAVRHRGFIPWDDDLDIFMPREDFNRFMDIAPKLLKDKFQLRWANTEKNYFLYFAKVVLRGTLFCEKKRLQEENEGIFLDIFPLDYSTKYNKVLEIRYFLILQIRQLLYVKGLRYDNSLLSVIRKFIAKRCTSVQLLKLLERIANTPYKKNRTCYINFPSSVTLKSQVFPIEWFGNGRYAEFDGRMYKVPNNPEKILEQTYGANFMELPPESKRVTHNPQKVVFSDGYTIDFSNNN